MLNAQIFINLLTANSALLGVPLGGQILGAMGGDYTGLIVFSGMAYAVALISFITVRVMKVGFKVAQKF